MKDILTAPFIRELCELCGHMYRLGWDERNAGNVSLLLDEEEAARHLDTARVLRRFSLDFDAGAMAGRLLLVTGTGEYFRTLSRDPEKSLGILRIAESGRKAELLWGYREGRRFTSELASHILSHKARLAADPGHRVVLHSHPTHLVAMTAVCGGDEREFTRALWKSCSECIMVFPEGVGLLPWMPFGTAAIGEATAQKMARHRLVVWPLHGIYGAGRSMDEAFGLIEVAEKAAQLYLLTAHLPQKTELTDERLRLLAETLKLDAAEEYL